MPYQISSFEEYQSVYTNSVENPEGFWADIASHFTWRKPWSKVLDGNFDEPRISWFKDARLNITENCLDRHLPNRGDQATRLIGYIISKFTFALFSR